MLSYGVYLASSSICSNERSNFMTCSFNLIDHIDARNLFFTHSSCFEFILILLGFVVLSNERLSFMFRFHTIDNSGVRSFIFTRSCSDSVRSCFEFTLLLLGFVLMSNESLSSMTCSFRFHLIDTSDARGFLFSHSSSSRVTFLFDHVFEHAVECIVLMSD